MGPRFPVWPIRPAGSRISSRAYWWKSNIKIQHTKGEDPLSGSKCSSRNPVRGRSKPTQPDGGLRGEDSRCTLTPVLQVNTVFGQVQYTLSPAKTWNPLSSHKKHATLP